MKNTTYGYQNVWNWTTMENEQISVAKPISKELKQFLDGKVLEGRVKESFDANTEFSEAAEKIEGGGKH
jgi:hypothetical protein